MGERERRKSVLWRHTIVPDWSCKYIWLGEHPRGHCSLFSLSRAVHSQDRNWPCNVSLEYNIQSPWYERAEGGHAIWWERFWGIRNLLYFDAYELAHCCSMSLPAPANCCFSVAHARHGPGKSQLLYINDDDDMERPNERELCNSVTLHSVDS